MPSASKVNPTLITQDPEYQSLQHVRDTQRAKPEKLLGPVKQSKGTRDKNEYNTTKLCLAALKASIKRRREAAAHEDFFAMSPSRHIDEQRRGVQQGRRPTQPTFLFAERNRLLTLLFESRNPKR